MNAPRRRPRWRGGAAFAVALATFAACTDFNGLRFSPDASDVTSQHEAGRLDDGQLGPDSFVEPDAFASQDTAPMDEGLPARDAPLTNDSPSDAGACTGAGVSFNPANGHCYRFSPILFGWSAARSDCQIWGGDLVSITVGTEEAFVTNMINSELAADAGPDDVWIGLEKGDAGYVWSDGEPMGFTNWAGAEPTGKACVVQFTARFSDHWASYQCNVNAPYICERP